MLLMMQHVLPSLKIQKDIAMTNLSGQKRHSIDQWRMHQLALTK